MATYGLLNTIAFESEAPNKTKANKSKEKLISDRGYKLLIRNPILSLIDSAGIPVIKCTHNRRFL